MNQKDIGKNYPALILSDFAGARYKRALANF
jgi:hypothetical protein